MHGKPKCKLVIVFTNTDIFGVYIPMLVVLFTNIVIFVKLWEQPVTRKHTSTNEKGNQFQSISKRFVIIVCTFCVCLLPKTIVNNYQAYYYWVEGVMSINNMPPRF